MKTIDIAGDSVTYYYKDEQGNTIPTKLDPQDKTCIQRDIERGKDKGKLVAGDLTLYWSVEF